MLLCLSKCDKSTSLCVCWGCCTIGMMQDLLITKSEYFLECCIWSLSIITAEGWSRCCFPSWTAVRWCERFQSLSRTSWDWRKRRFSCRVQRSFKRFLHPSVLYWRGAWNQASVDEQLITVFGVTFLGEVWRWQHLLQLDFIFFWPLSFVCFSISFTFTSYLLRFSTSSCNFPSLVGLWGQKVKIFCRKNAHWNGGRRTLLPLKKHSFQSWDLWKELVVTILVISFHGAIKLCLTLRLNVLISEHSVSHHWEHWSGFLESTTVQGRERLFILKRLLLLTSGSWVLVE